MNELELRLGRLAVERAESPEVVAMAKKMVQQHTEVGRQLSALARRQGVSGMREPSAEQDAAVTRLEGMFGAEFDGAFVSTVDMVRQQELAMYTDGATRSSDPRLRALARTRVDALQQLVRSGSVD